MARIQWVLLLCFILTEVSAATIYQNLLTAYLRFPHNGNITKTAAKISTRRALTDGKLETTGDSDLKNKSSAISSKKIENDEVPSARVDWNFPVKKHHYSLKQDDFCGESNFNGLSRIIGGEAAVAGNWPWTVALGYEKLEGHDVIYLCGGTLITTQHVLTAAHCVHSTSPKFVLMGVIDLQDTESGHIELIAKAKIHEGYNEANNANDIALLRLEHAVNFTKYIRPACLPLSSTVRKDDNYMASQAYVAGWGTTQSFNQTSSRFLHWAAINVSNRTICNEAYQNHSKLFKRTVDSRMICAAHLEWKKDACQGDSGGPLVWPYDNSFYLIGIVSFGNGCAFKDFPGVYVRVANYTKWIQNSIEALQLD